VPELTARRKADRAAMALQVADLAAEYQLDIWLRPEQPGTRRVGVDLAGPHGLRLTVDFDGSRRALALDVYVLNWHGVEEGTRLHPGMFGHVNEAYGHKATDVAHGFDQLLRTLRDRFKVIADGSAFITSGGSGAVG
jgi:hypothetical protein